MASQQLDGGHAALVWYVDSSVVLRIVKEGSPAARQWFTQALAAGGRMVSSRLMKLEVLRVLQNNDLEAFEAIGLIARFVLLSLDDDLAEEALSLSSRLGAADAIHVASARRVGAEIAILVTHDPQMATAAKTLGFAVVDPVTDDPLHPPPQTL